MSELVKAEERPVAALTPLPVEAILTRQAQVKQIMAEVMKPDVHYGTIPGCEKPSLYQAGAEKLAMTFGLAISFPHEDMRLTQTPEMVRADVRCVITDMGSGRFLGDEYGTCSSDEEKYAWRKCYEEDYNAADPAKRRKATKKGKGGGTYIAYQVRTNPADVANTVLAMACKRAKVRAVRSVLGVSDMFEVNIEDLPEELREEYFGDQSDDETKAAKAAQQQKANTMEQRARAGATATPKTTAEKEAVKVSKEQVRDFMQAMGNIEGFTFKYEKDGKQKTGFSDEAKEFLRSVGAGGFFPEMEALAGAKVIKALEAEKARREEAAAQSYEPETINPDDDDMPHVEDPFADQ